MHCSTCKHWVLVDIAYPNNSFIGIQKQGGFCRHPKISEDFGLYSYEKDSMVYSYYEGGEFWTGPEFGCVLHEKKPCSLCERQKGENYVPVKSVDAGDRFYCCMECQQLWAASGPESTNQTQRSSGNSTGHSSP